MTTWDERIGTRPPARLPKLERVKVFWRVQAPTSGRVYECVLYATDAGLELRMQRNEDDAQDRAACCEVAWRRRERCMESRSEPPKASS